MPGTVLVCEVLENVIDEMFEGFQVIGRDWKYIYVNLTVAKQGKSTREALIGQTMMEKYPGIEKTFFFEQLRKCMDERISIRMENEFVYPDQSVGWFQLFLHPCEEGVFILSIDISDQKRAEKNLNQKIDQLNKMMDLVTNKQEEVIKLKEIVADIRGAIFTTGPKVITQ